LLKKVAGTSKVGARNENPSFKSLSKQKSTKDEASSLSREARSLTADKSKLKAEVKETY